MKKFLHFLALSFTTSLFVFALTFFANNVPVSFAQIASSPVSSFKVISGYLQAFMKDGTSLKFKPLDTDNRLSIASTNPTILFLQSNSSITGLGTVDIEQRDANGVMKTYYNRFATSGTGAHNIFTVPQRSSGTAELGSCDASTGAGITYSSRIHWSANGDGMSSQITEEAASANASTQFSGNTLQVTPGAAGQDEWCITVRVMGRAPGNATLTWAL
jgi:hypothetical protein